MGGGGEPLGLALAGCGVRRLLIAGTQGFDFRSQGFQAAALTSGEASGAAARPPGDGAAGDESDHQGAQDGQEKTRRALADGVDTILVVGGDGMVNSIGSVNDADEVAAAMGETNLQTIVGPVAWDGATSSARLRDWRETH